MSLFAILQACEARALYERYGSCCLWTRTYAFCRIRGMLHRQRPFRRDGLLSEVRMHDPLSLPARCLGKPRLSAVERSFSWMTGRAFPVASRLLRLARDPSTEGTRSASPGSDCTVPLSSKGRERKVRMAGDATGEVRARLLEVRSSVSGP